MMSQSHTYIARCGIAADDGHTEVVRQLLRSGTVDLNLQSNGAGANHTTSECFACC